MNQDWPDLRFVTQQKNINIDWENRSAKARFTLCMIKCSNIRSQYAFPFANQYEHLFSHNIWSSTIQFFFLRFILFSFSIVNFGVPLTGDQIFLICHTIIVFVVIIFYFRLFICWRNKRRERKKTDEITSKEARARLVWVSKNFDVNAK